MKKPEKKTVTIQLFEDDLGALLDTLVFAQGASSLLYQQEATKNPNSDSASKMKTISNDANDLYRILYAHLNIGNPSSDVLN